MAMLRSLNRADPLVAGTQPLSKPSGLNELISPFIKSAANHQNVFPLDQSRSVATHNVSRYYPAPL